MAKLKFWKKSTNVFVAIVVWILMLVTDNHTLMDKLWPILPSFYAGLFFLSLFLNPTTNSSIKLKTNLQNLDVPCMIRLGILVEFLSTNLLPLDPPMDYLHNVVERSHDIHILSPRLQQVDLRWHDGICEKAIHIENFTAYI